MRKQQLREMANALGDSKFESGVLSENRIARINRSCADAVQASDIGAIHLFGQLVRLAQFTCMVAHKRRWSNRRWIL
jgi:hypothetical protein